MTISVSDNTPRVSYSVSEGATQTSFTVSFEFFADADLNVYVDGTKKTLTTHYSVTGGDGSTGSISMSVTGASGGSTVVITRGIALERTTDFPVSGAFAVGTLNTELDRFVAIQADLNDTITRSVRLQDDDSAVSMELPLKAARLGTVLGFNASTGAAEAGPTIANVNSLSAITANINTVAGISSNVTTVAGVASNVTTVAGVASNVTTVAGIASNVTSVANDATDIGAVAGKATEIGRLGTSASVTSLGLLGTSDAVSDMNTLAAISSNITSVANVSSNVTTVAGIASNVTTVAGKASLITSDFAADMALIDSTFVTKMNLVTSDFVTDMAAVTSDFISDLNTLATSDIVSDLNTLATADIVSDLNTLATSAIVEDLNLLATSSVIADMASLAGSGANPNITSVTASGAVTAGSFVIGSADINENDLEAIDGITAGTVAASKAAVVDTNKDITGFRNITLTGELDAGSLDVSGDADIDGTLEADAITVNGTTLTEYIQDTVGGMVTGNTETGIAVTYEDGDGTLDFVVSASPTAADDIATGDAAVTIATSTGNITFDAQGSDTDIIFKGTDGSSDTTFLTLDGSDAGAATFTGAITANGGIDLNGTELILDADADTSITADSDDVIDFRAGGTDIVSMGGANSGMDIKSSLGLRVVNGSETMYSVVCGNDGVTTFMTNRTDGTTAHGSYIFNTRDGGTTVTRMTVDSSGIDVTGAIAVDTMTLDDDTITATGTFTIDAASTITLDADNAAIALKDGGTQVGSINMTSSDLQFVSEVSDKDMKFTGKDGSSFINALVLDMSEAGAATFNNNVTAYSDVRLKSDIKTIEDSLAKVEQLRGVTYIRDDNVDGGQQLGVIAQEVEEVFPQVVLTADDERGTKSVDYGRLTGALIEAVKELSVKVKNLEEQLNGSTK